MKKLLALLILCSSLAVFGEVDMVIIDEDFKVGNKLSLDIDIDGAELKVGKSADKKCHVYVKYDKDRARADIRFNDQRGIMDVSVDMENWNMSNDSEHPAPRVRIDLPEQCELEIETRIKAGEIDFQLGGLSIADFMLKNWAGEVDIDFDEPNKIEMRTFDMNCKVGEMTVKNLGNARFENALINGGIGELTVDFHGELRSSCTADIDLNLGETEIILPENVGIKAKVSRTPLLSEASLPNWFEKRGNYYYSENYDAASKDIFINISTGIGELRVVVD